MVEIDFFHSEGSRDGRTIRMGNARAKRKKKKKKIRKQGKISPRNGSKEISKGR